MQRLIECSLDFKIADMSVNLPEKPLILLVDDMPANLHVLAAALKADYEIKLATSGAAALELAQLDDKPQLILLDVIMPGMNGIEVLRRLREHPKTLDIPIAMVSADASEQSQINGLELGADDYLIKPVVANVLLVRVKILIQRKQTERILRDARQRLENQIASTHTELDEIKKRFAEIDNAFNVLLRHRGTDISDTQNALSREIEGTILPFLKRLRGVSSDATTRLVDILEANLTHLIKSYGHASNLIAAYQKLTPTEVQVASMVRQGLATKHIAASMNLSPGTVSIHRKNIRRKLELEGKSDNLYSYLVSLDE